MSTTANSFSANDLKSASEQMFISLTRSAPVGIYRTDVIGKCYYVNDRWCQIAGLTSMEAEGFGWVNGIHPSDRELVSAEWNASVEEKRPFSLEYRFLNKSGQITCVFGQAVSERNETSEIIGYVGTITDISDRKATEQALKLQRDLNQLIAEISSRFIDISPDQLDAEIERTLQLIGEATNSDTSYLIEFSIPDRSDLLLPDGTVSITHEWSKPQYPRQIALVQNVPLSVFPWSNAKLLRREIVNITRVADTPIEAAIDQASWEQFNIVSVLSVPIIRKSVVIGTMGFASFSDVVIWDEEIIRLLQVMAQTIANAQQRARDEQQLYESEERLRLALKAANQGLYDLNLQTGEAITSLEYATMLGYNPATFQETNAKWVERLHPDDRERVAKVYQDYVAGILPEYKVEFRQYTQTGEWKWILSLGKIVSWDEAGNPLRMLGTHTDISDRKYAEEQAQHRLDILEAARDIIASIDFTGKVTYFNQAGRALLGIAPDEEVSHTDITDYHSPEMADFILQEAIPQCVQNGFWAGETRFRRRDGSEFPVLQTIVCHRQKDGFISHFSTIARDISDRKQAEASLQQLNQELEIKVEERTAALKASEATIRATLEAIPDLLLRLRRDGTCVEYIRTGIRADNFLPVDRHISEVLPQELLQNQMQIIEQAFLTKELQVYEHHFLKRDLMVYEEIRIVAINDEEVLAIVRDISDRKQAEEALRESEELKKRILESSRDCIKLIDLDGQLKYMSAGGQCIMEIDDFSLFLNADWVSLWPEASRLDLEAAIAMAKTGQTGRFQGFCPTAKGTPKWWDVMFTPILDESGQVSQLLSVSRDISDLKQAEQENLENQRFIQKIADASPNILYLYDLQEHCNVYSNREIASVLGYTPTEIQAMGAAFFANLMHPEDIAKIPDYYRQIEAGREGEIFEIEYRMLHANGEWRWLYSRDTVFSRDNRGQIKLTIGTAQDISDRKQAEEQLKTLSEHLTLAIKSGDIGIWDWNVLDNILIWDDRMYELYGITPNQFTSVYDAWASSLHPDDRTVTELAIQQALTGEKDYNPEFRVVHPDGTIRFIQGYALVQRNAQGEAIRMIGMNIDITNQKRAEAKLRETSAQLSASNRELEAFAYSVSHDLRSPLRAIDGFSKALLEDYGDKFDADAKDYFDRIRSNVARMGTLIDDLLSLSRVSRSEIEYRKVNLSILVQEQLDELQTTDPQRQVEIAIAPNVWVSADPSLMRVVVSNLIQNAWKFTSHHATARIEFGMLASENQQENEQFTYFIRDNGAGFDMNYVKKLFGVFQRLHNTNEFAGTGIGLATVQRVIHRHGGRVWAEGAVEKGATIYFTLPNSSSQELK